MSAQSYMYLSVFNDQETLTSQGKLSSSDYLKKTDNKTTPKKKHTLNSNGINEKKY